MQVGVQVLDVLGLGGVDVARDVEVVVVLRSAISPAAPSASSASISICLLKTSTILWMSWLRRRFLGRPS